MRHCKTNSLDNKAKGRISKRVFQENKARQIFRKTNISYPLIPWFPPGLESPRKSWNLKRVLESPGIWKESWKVLKFEKSPRKSWNLKRVLESPEIWNFAEILEKSWRSPRIFLWSSSLKERFPSKCQHVESGSSLTNCFDFHLRYIGCNNVYIFSAHHWVMIFKFAIKSLILELWNCMSNSSTTVFCLIHHPLGHVNT